MSSLLQSVPFGDSVTPSSSGEVHLTIGDKTLNLVLLWGCVAEFVNY